MSCQTQPKYLLLLHMPQDHVVLIDNNDSFTWMLRESLLLAGISQVRVIPVQQFKLPDLEAGCKGVVISPGPGTPDENGLPECVQLLSGKVKVLGVCLGLQAIVMAHGGLIINLKTVFHGSCTQVEFSTESVLFSGCEKPFNAGLYHSWAADDSGFPDSLRVIARSAQGIIMAVEHQSLPIFGVQFHPESHLTPQGIQLLRNWLYA